MKKINSVYFLMIFLLVEMAHAMQDESPDYTLVDSWLCLEEDQALKPTKEVARIAVGANLTRESESVHGSFLSERSQRGKKRKARAIEKKQIYKDTKQNSSEIEKIKEKITLSFGYYCLECSEWFPTTQRNAHKEFHVNPQCICFRCKMSFSTRTRLISHSGTTRCKNKKVEPKKTYRCYLCNVLYDSMAKWREHYEVCKILSEIAD